MIRLPIPSAAFAEDDPDFILDFLMKNGKDRYDFWFDEDNVTTKWLVPVYGELLIKDFHEAVTLTYDGVSWASMSDVENYNFSVVTGTRGMALYVDKADIPRILDGTLCIKYTTEERAFCLFTLAIVE